MKRLLQSVACLALPVIVGCGSGSGPASGSSSVELLLYCGAGVRPPVAELTERFEQREGVKVVTDFAGSQVLLSKIKLGGHGDLYLPGDQHYLEQAAAQDLIVHHRPLCYFVPTILVRKGNPKGIRSLEDLAGPGIKLGLGHPEACAIGRISRRLFATNGVAWKRVERNLAFQSMTVNELGLQIQSGALDAVVVWDAIAAYYADHGEAVGIPSERNLISTVEVGVLATSRQREWADRFVAFAASGEGQAVFRKHHYRVEDPFEPEPKR